MYGNDNPPEDLYFADGSDDEFQDEIPEFEIPEDEDFCDFDDDDMAGEDYDWE